MSKKRVEEDKMRNEAISDVVGATLVLSHIENRESRVLDIPHKCL